MIKSLDIKNYALIDQLHLEFSNGLSIITGETGAGKSILLGAFALILGKRADTSVLNDQEKKCIVEAEFDVSNYSLRPFFERNDIDYDNLTLIRREIAPSGKSRAFINDTPVNLGILQELSSFLVDIHSQNQNLSLNKQDFLLGVLDKYAGLEKELASYLTSFQEYKSSLQEYHSYLEKLESFSKEQDFLSHQYNELESAKLVEGEVTALEAELGELEHIEDIKSAYALANGALSDDEQGLLASLKKSWQALGKISSYSKTAGEIAERLEANYIDLKDVSVDIAHQFDQLEYDPMRLEQVQQRLNLLYNLQHKHRVSSEQELIAIHDKLSKQLAQLTDGDMNLEELKKKYETFELKARSGAKMISGCRKDRSKELGAKIEKVLKSLGMPHAIFEVEFAEKDMGSSGMDVVRFMFSANKNHALDDISKVASGGELSRLMLAIKYMISHSAGLPTIVLDEIDTGVSGDVASKVGEIVKSMSSGMQVLNITHLPQVASKGDSHFLVYKDHSGVSTKTRVKLLGEDERLKEIAKMLSGEELTEAAIENARVLLQ